MSTLFSLIKNQKCTIRKQFWRTSWRDMSCFSGLDSEWNTLFILEPKIHETESLGCFKPGGNFIIISLSFPWRHHNFLHCQKWEVRSLHDWQVRVLQGRRQVHNSTVITIPSSGRHSNTLLPQTPPEWATGDGRQPRGECQAALLWKPRDELRGEEGTQVWEVTAATEGTPGGAKENPPLNRQA